MRVIENTNRPNQYTEAICLDEPGAGGMCHCYNIASKEVDPNTGGQLEHADIRFQNGPIKENGVNGCQNEDLIIVVIDRLRGAQQGDFACRGKRACNNKT